MATLSPWIGHLHPSKSSIEVLDLDRKVTRVQHLQHKSSHDTISKSALLLGLGEFPTSLQHRLTSRTERFSHNNLACNYKAIRLFERENAGGYAAICLDL